MNWDAALITILIVGFLGIVFAFIGLYLKFKSEGKLL